MEELRDKLINLINKEGLLSERVIELSQELDKIIIEYYKEDKYNYY
ncbi:MAG TPA: aspartyl-phosphate phosphatase Spo0E family protein [Clostridiaceae bacterium]